MMMLTELAMKRQSGGGARPRQIHRPSYHMMMLTELAMKQQLTQLKISFSVL